MSVAVRSLFALLLLASLARPAAADFAYPLSVAPDARHLVDSGGRRLFLNADAPWHLFARLTREEAVEYLDDRQAKGSNALMVVDGYNTGSVDNAYGEPPFLIADDFSTPNEPYFAHVDWVMEEAHRRGMLLLITPAYLGWECGNQGWCDAIRAQGPTAMRAWGRWVGTRYADQPNIVWLNGGDANPIAEGVVALVDEINAGIRETDTVHLHSAHCVPGLAGSQCYSPSVTWMAFDTTYANCGAAPRQIRDNYQRTPARPVLYLEGRYELEYDWTPVCIRSQAYWALLGGHIGHIFGSGKIWDFPSDWRTGLDTEGSRAMREFGQLVRSRRWGLLEPDHAHQVMTAGHGSVDTGNYAAAARMSDGSSILAYMPSQRTVTVDLRRIAGDRAVAWWYHPVTGATTSIGSFPTTQSRDFTPPAAGDWVLVVDSEAAQFDPPGTTDIGVSNAAKSVGGLKSLYR